MENNKQDKQRQAVVRVLKAVYETIQEMGPNGAPEGPLYAALMSQGCTLEQFQKIIGMLESSGLVKRNGFVLHAVRV